ncbi:transcription elongation factor spt5 [Cucurbita moschata]|uniref:Transcription elongation factor spt5 n=1 Tax=Cucurbita moschata TaxID=3662 RepID=A0A6J1GZI9_CUCMO|nr:transcription elongation factor spt5 [Cucurbita moschata]XP_022957552.1 transcription elongation factor spt5 [Cucurbita moschata]
MSTSESKLQDAESNAAAAAAAAKTPEDQQQLGAPNHSEEKSPEESGQSGKISESGGEDEGGEDLDEEEEEECGFCLFMKGGGCRDSFVEWEKCIEEAEKNKEDIVEKCFEITGALKKCMEAHADYYEPILKAEKMAENEAIIELEKESTPNAT